MREFQLFKDHKLRKWLNIFRKQLFPQFGSYSTSLHLTIRNIIQILTQYTNLLEVIYCFYEKCSGMSQDTSLQVNFDCCYEKRKRADAFSIFREEQKSI